MSRYVAPLAGLARVRPATPQLARGVSLIEALVAFAVLAFGMLGVAGMQATLRYNGDIAKQRSEAVRIAQESLEDLRSFSVLAPTPGHAQSYAAIASAPQAVVPGYTTNTEYHRSGTVGESAPLNTQPATKTLVADVQWTDRSGTLQTVRLASMVAGVAPELAATLVAPGSGLPTRNPLGRHRGIPPQARDFGNGSSGFVPPQAVGGTVGWLFDNVTGLFKLCTTFVQNNAALQLADLFCNNAQNYMLVSGYVRYATQAVQPQAADVDDAAALGPDFALPGIAVVQTAPAAFAGTYGCYLALGNAATFRDYYCGVPILVEVNGVPVQPKWSGSIQFGAPLALAVNAADAAANRYRVCRYFAAANYANVTTALQNQNFVIIKAGDGANAFSCPAGVTWTHQPPP